MCVVSMIQDHYIDRWNGYTQPAPTITYTPQIPSQAEIDEFRRLLERARKYDRENNQPDCGLEDKKRILLDLATVFGIDISFIEANG